MGSYGNIEDLGALIIWIFRGFRGTFKECKNSRYSFEIGFGFIIFVVLILSFL